MVLQPFNIAWSTPWLAVTTIVPTITVGSAAETRSNAGAYSVEGRTCADLHQYRGESHHQGESELGPFAGTSSSHYLNHQLSYRRNSVMRTTISALIFALVGLTSHLAVANDGFAASGNATVGQRQPKVFRVQPTMESVREGLALKRVLTPIPWRLRAAQQHAYSSSDAIAPIRSLFFPGAPGRLCWRRCVVSSCAQGRDLSGPGKTA